MLTIGSKQLKHFAPLQGRVEMLARILPSSVSTEQAFWQRRLSPLSNCCRCGRRFRKSSIAASSPSTASTCW